MRSIHRTIKRHARTVLGQFPVELAALIRRLPLS